METSKLVLLADKELASSSVVNVGRTLEEKGLQVIISSRKTALRLYDESKNSRSKGVECVFCGTYIKTVDDIAQHRSSCSSKKRKSFHSYPCPAVGCDMHYNCLENLSDHQKAMHNIDEFTCHQCNRSFYSKKTLQAHSVWHDLEHTVEDGDGHVQMLTSEILKLKKTRPRVVLTSDDELEDEFLSTLKGESVDSLVMVERRKYDLLSSKEKMEMTSRFLDRGATDLLFLPLGEEEVGLVKGYITLDDDDEEEDGENQYLENREEEEEDSDDHEEDYEED